MREIVPQVKEVDGVSYWFVKGDQTGRLGPVKDRAELESRRARALFQTRPGDWDPAERLKDYTLDGVDAGILFPSYSGFSWDPCSACTPNSSGSVPKPAWAGNYIIEGCDHEWERRHLWTEGIIDRPSDLFHRQMWVDFWYEKTGIDMRHSIGLDHIMWESDFPHSTSTYPQSWEFVERTLRGVPEQERKQLQYANEGRLYKLA